MIATYHPKASSSVSPISRWEDDGGPDPAVLRSTHCAPLTVNIGGTERAISALAGGSLLAYGLSRRSLSGLLTALVGGGLIYRGLTGHCGVYEALGVSTLENTPEECLRTAEPSSVERDATLSSGPVEYRSSATPPIHAATDHAIVVPPQDSAVLANPLPTASAKSDSEHAALPGVQSQPATPDPRASLSVERMEQPSGAEPQGRT